MFEDVKGRRLSPKQRAEKIAHTLENIRVVSESTIGGLVRATAGVAHTVSGLNGCERRDIVDLVATGALALGLHQQIPGKRCISWITERKSDDSTALPEGSEFGKILDPPVLVISDAIECAGEFVRRAGSRKPSSVLVALAPAGTVPIGNRLSTEIQRGSRAFKICLPPGAPVGPGKIEIDTPPAVIVRMLQARFGCSPRDIEVFALRREWNQRAIDEFTRAGATVNTSRVGDFDEHWRAGLPVGPEGRVHMTYGIGGLPEGFLIVPFLRWTGGTMLLSPVSYGKEHLGLSVGPRQVFTTSSMIDSNDCILAIVGLSSANGREIVPGFHADVDKGQLLVSVLLASPMFERCRRFEVVFNQQQPRQVAEIDPWPVDIGSRSIDVPDNAKWPVFENAMPCDSHASLTSPSLIKRTGDLVGQGMIVAHQLGMEWSEMTESELIQLGEFHSRSFDD